MEGGAEFEPASTAVKHLGSCCQDSDNVLDKINALHDKLSRLSKLSKKGYPVSMPKNSCRSRTPPLPGFNLTWRPKRGPRWGGEGGGGKGGRRGVGGMVMGKGRIAIHLRAPSFLLPQTVKGGISHLSRTAGKYQPAMDDFADSASVTIFHPSPWGREFLESTVPVDEPMCRRWFRARRGGGASVPEAADDVCESQGPRGGCMSAPE